MKSNKTKENNAQIGRHMIYPGHGLCQVTELRNRTFGEKNCQMCILKNIRTGMTIMLPVSDIADHGLRSVIDKKEVNKVLSILSKRGSVEQSTWNRRYREYMDKINTGSIYEVALVLANLNTLKKIKGSSFGERKMKELCLGLLSEEMAVSLEINDDKAREMILNQLT